MSLVVNAFPVGSRVRAGQFRGIVAELAGPYSVRIRLANGQLLASTTTDMVEDLEAGAAPAAPAPAVSTAAQGSLF